MATKKKTSGPEIGATIQIDPNTVYIDPSNPRFAMKPGRVQAMAENIRDNAMSGGPGVRNAVEVQAIPEDLKAQHPDKVYLLQTGSYRTLGLMEANKQFNLGLSLPASLRSPLSGLDLLMARLSENNDRENMSLMDCARAVKDMVDLGAPKIQVRKAFAQPKGPKGTMKDRANGWVNVMLAFCTLPEKAQNLIHNGVMGYDAAYSLTRKPQDKWDEIIASCIADYDAAEKKEDQAETKLLEQEKKEADRAQKIADAQKAVEDAQAVYDSSLAALEAKKVVAVSARESAVEAYRVKKQAGKGESEAADKNFKQAEANQKSADIEVGNAQKVVDDNKKKLDAAMKKIAPAPTVPDEAPEAPAPKPTTAPAKKKAPQVTKAAIDKAAKVAGVPAETRGTVAKSLKDARFIIESIIKLSPHPKYERTRLVGQIILDGLNGKITDGEVQLGISKLFGEPKGK